VRPYKDALELASSVPHSFPVQIADWTFIFHVSDFKQSSSGGALTEGFGVMK
jgi:hypothetical protein